MFSYSKNLFSIILILYFVVNMIQLPLFSHGASDNCLEECQSYYCPEGRGNEEDKKPLQNKKN